MGLHPGMGSLVIVNIALNTSNELEKKRNVLHSINMNNDLQKKNTLLYSCTSQHVALPSLSPSLH